MVVKSRKPKEPSGQVVSTLQKSLPSEFALRQEEVQTPPASRQNELKSDAKKALSKTAEQADNSDIVDQIKPALPTENPPLGLEIQLPPSSGTQDQTIGENTSSPTETLTSNEAPAQPEAKREEPPAAQPPAAKPKPGDLVPLGEVTMQPALIKRVDPKYPSQAFSMGVSGTVTLNILISETGDVLRTEIQKGIKGGYGFEKAAETAVRQWKYRPAQKEGIPVRVWKSVDINFQLSPKQTEETYQ
jgi:TonB family protein